MTIKITKKHLKDIKEEVKIDRLLEEYENSFEGMLQRIKDLEKEVGGMLEIVSELHRNIFSGTEE